MKNKYISINECKLGMRLGEDITNVFGTMIASKNSIVDELMIEKLKLNKIDSLYIVEEKNVNNQDLEQRKEFGKKYTENVSEIKNIMKDIGNGKDANIKYVMQMGNTMVENSSNMKIGNIITCLKQVREVDNYTYNHCVNVSVLCMTIGKWLGFNEEKVKLLATAGLLHDIGKASVPEEILNKPGKLTQEEYEQVKKHTIYGYRMVEKVADLPKSVAYGVLMHHEREDGTGYPMNALGSHIHEFGKIVAVADVYDAMTSKRVYHEAESPFKVLEMFQSSSFGRLDSKILLNFLNNMANYYIGDIVILNTGEEAEITYINPLNVSKPIVKVDNTIIDLSKEFDVWIEGLA